MSLLKSIKNEFNAASAVYIRAWKINKRYPVSLVFFTFAPILWLLPILFYGWAVSGDRYSEVLLNLTGTDDVLVYTALGVLFLAFFDWTLWGTAFSVREEEWLGTLESVYITPASKFAIVFGNSLFYISQSAIGSIIQLVIIILLMKNQISIFSILLASLFLITSIVFVQAIAIVLASAVLWFKQGYRIVMLLQVFFMIITPATFPIVVLPNVLRGFAIINPLTFAMEGFRSAILFGFSPQLTYYLLILAITIPITLFAGMLIFKKSERLLRKKALIGKY
ncbi:MAG: ABC transporter permease [Candidatus Heimdallarchaeaceae archaeon]